MVWAAGQQLQGGRYVIQKKIGEGGFGITYKAQHRNLQQYVVIKTINDTLRNNPEYSDYVNRFIQEGQILAQLSKNPHPHIVRVIDLFEEYGLWCMVMEYIEGEDLSSRVAKRGVLPETEALRYIQQIGEALTVVHKQGLLHRDVKPQNIMLRSGTSEAVLIDFGIAREFIPEQTQSHTQFVSYGFAPIEQCYRRGKRGAYTDVYALAATLYVLLTGYIRPDVFQHRLPHSMDRDFDIRNHNNDPLVPPKGLNSNISDQVNQAILKGLAVQPENRPQSMQEWLKLLKVGNRNEKVSSPPKQASPASSPRKKEISIPWLGLTGVLLIYTIGGFVSAPSAWAWALVWALALALALVDALAGAEPWTSALVWPVCALFLASAWASASAWFSALAAWVEALPWNQTSTSVWDGALSLTLIFALAWMLAWFCNRGWSMDYLMYSSSKFHAFLILHRTSWLGLGLGWMVYQIYMIFR